MTLPQNKISDQNIVSREFRRNLLRRKTHTDILMRTHARPQTDTGIRIHAHLMFT